MVAAAPTLRQSTPPAAHGWRGGVFVFQCPPVITRRSMAGRNGRIEERLCHAADELRDLCLSAKSPCRQITEAAWPDAEEDNCP